MKPNDPQLGESPLQAVKRFQLNEAAISKQETWQAFQDMVKENIDLGHAELVPTSELQRPDAEMYYLPPG